MAATKDDVISFIDNMSVLEMSEFVKELEDKYGSPRPHRRWLLRRRVAEKPPSKRRPSLM